MSEGNDKYIELIRQLIPISELSSQGQTEIINSGSLLNLKKKGSLFKQGDRDNFSFYLLEGEIELHANDQQQNVISAGTDRALYAMAQLQPRQFSAKAKTDCVVFQIQRDNLDRLMVLQEQDEPADDLAMESTDVEVGVLEEDDDVDWMTRMLQSELFARLPTANIGQLFALLTEVHFSKGDVVIKQGDPGDNYYIIQEGKCDVLRTPPSGGKDLKLATLGVGDSFGEEALISESIRNATIVMATDGVLMELSKENFIELIKKPSLTSVSYEEASAAVEAGAAWLDVRFKKEHESHAIPGSVHIPLNMLRMQASKLDLDKKYIVYCDTGGRSSTGAFLLAERAFDVSYLEGGIVNNPEAADKSEVTQVPAEPPKQAKTEAPKPETPKVEAPKTEAPKSEAPKTEAPKPAQPAAAEPEAKPAAPAAAKPEPAPAPAPKPEVVPETREDVVEEISRQNIDPDVKASVLEAELNRTNMQLEEVEKAKQKADASIKEAQAEVEKQLQEERAKIEKAKQEAEAEAAKLRQQEEEKIQQMKVEAEKRMAEEKQKLEEVYSRNAAEMEKIEQMKAEAEALVQQERERLAKAAEEAKKQMEEAEALKAQMESALQKEAEESRQQLEEAAALKKQMEESRQKAAAETNKQLQEAEAIKNEIDALRQKEADEAAKKLAEAQKLKEEVEASRKAMEEAAEQRRLEQEQMEQQIQAAAAAKLEEERRKLSEEFAKNNEELEQARREKAEAEAARHAAKEEAEKIIAEYKMTKDQSHAEEEAKLRAERIKLEEEQQNIKQQLLEVQKIKEEAEAAKKAAMAEVAELRAKQEADTTTTDKSQQDSITDELKLAQAKLNKASVEIAQAQQAQVKAVAAKNENEVDLKNKLAAEENLRAQMAADLSDFKREIEEEEQAYANSNTIMEKMRRIKESAEAAKKETQEKNSGLLDDIAAQLGDDN